MQVFLSHVCESNLDPRQKGLVFAVSDRGEKNREGLELGDLVQILALLPVSYMALDSL